MRKMKVDCTSCNSFFRMIYINEEEKMGIAKYCIYKDKELTSEEINDVCDAYEEKIE